MSHLQTRKLRLRENDLLVEASGSSERSQAFSEGHIQVEIPVAPGFSHVTVGPLFMFPERVMPHLKNGDKNTSQG